MTKVIAFGDSILKGVLNNGGHYSLCKNSFASLCAERLGIELNNRAKLGATVTDGDRLLDKYIEKIAGSDYSYVVLLYGGNDSDYDWTFVSENPGVSVEPHTPLPLYRNTYISMIDRIRDTGKEPVILSLPPICSEKYFSWVSRNLNRENILDFLGGKVSFMERWHEVYNIETFKIAAEKGVRIIDISSCMLARRDYDGFLCMDGIHPNEKGYALMADAICDYVKKEF